MKTYFYFLLVFITLSGLRNKAVAQIPNPSFESWTGGVPNNWFGVSAYLSESNTAHAGSHACQLNVVNYSGYLVSGPIYAGNSSFFTCACRPEGLHFWYIFTSTGNSTFTVLANNLKGGNYFGGGGFVSDASSNSVYKEGILNYLGYPDNGNVDSTSIEIALVPGGSTYTAGTTLIIDDLSFGAAGTTGINDPTAISTLQLEKVQPNPASDQTNIIYTIPTDMHVSLDIYNLTGQKVRSLVNENQTPGRYKAILNVNELAEGTYFYQLNAGGTLLSDKMIVVK